MSSASARNMEDKSEGWTFAISRRYYSNSRGALRMPLMCKKYKKCWGT